MKPVHLREKVVIKGQARTGAHTGEGDVGVTPVGGTGSYPIPPHHYCIYHFSLVHVVVSSSVVLGMWAVFSTHPK